MTIGNLIDLSRTGILAWTLALAPSLAGADGGFGHWRAEHDHDRARQARASGEILPIAEILRRVAVQVPGEVIEVELERDEGPDKPIWIYELEILAPDGRLLEVEVDATQGRLLKEDD
ncbi:PepSY domain-containing protein [Thiocystis violacea]|uniref:PepSY domain-containing protein n=1 Tax=Thiocystis violacea TaxID=13725 RepID=UPI001907ADDC|nr:PepSY domain-containing protein [Thiocystis violacea]MBK1717042.1 hypothetical protein [Thiocystis violacea]